MKGGGAAVHAQDIRGLLVMLLEEEKGAFEAAMAEARDEAGRANPLTALHHSAAFQHHVVSLVEVVLGAPARMDALLCRRIFCWHHCAPAFSQGHRGTPDEIFQPMHRQWAVGVAQRVSQQHTVSRQSKVERPGSNAVRCIPAFETWPAQEQGFDCIRVRSQTFECRNQNPMPDARPKPPGLWAAVRHRAGAAHAAHQRNTDGLAAAAAGSPGGAAAGGPAVAGGTTGRAAVTAQRYDCQRR